MLSIEPEPWGCARCNIAAIAATTAMITMPMTTILAGGRLRLAVPNSSPMLNCVPESGGGVAAVAAGAGGAGAAAGGGAGEAGGGLLGKGGLYAGKIYKL